MIVLTRRGVPSSIRGEVWKVISGSAALKTKNPGVYFAMLEKPANPADQAAMLKDVSRTYPEHTHFQDSEGRGQRALLNVLTAYSNLDPAVGYCQGMSFVTATLVSQLNEEDAFWALVSLLKSHGLRSLYLPGLPLLKQFIFRLSSLLKAYLPDVSNHLSSIGMKHMFYSAEWFETLFAYNSNASITLRIWDCMFVEGPLYLCRVALAIMKLNHSTTSTFSSLIILFIRAEQILSMTFEENMVYIKQAASTLNEKVLSTANRWRGMGPLLQKVDATFELYREEITSHQDVIIPKKEQPKISNDTSLPFLLGLPPSFDAADDDTRIQCDNIYDRM